MIELLKGMFQYEFVQHAFIAGTFAAILCGIVGYFVIIRQLSFAAHALGHIGFAGATGGLLMGMSPFIGQILLTILASFGIGALGERIQKNDMVIGIILSFCLGLGTLFLYLYGGYAGQAMIILFGNLFGVSTNDIYIMLVLIVLSILVLGIISSRLLFASLEPQLAEAKGLSLSFISILFIILMAVAVTLASQVVGIILVFTLIIGPAAISIYWTNHFWSGIVFSLFLSIIIVWSGIVLSYVSDWPISFWISSIVFLLYLISYGKNKI